MTGRGCTTFLVLLTIVALQACSKPQEPTVETAAPEGAAATGQPPAAPEPVAVSEASAEPVSEPEPAAEVADDFDPFLFEADEDQLAPMMLSELGLFSDLPGQIPNDDVTPYGLNTEHFADYARVRRFVRIPQGAQARYRADGVFEFPVGTHLVQTFSYPADRRDLNGPERLVETRVYRRLNSGWDGVAYMWNKDQTDARRSLAGGIVPVEWTHDNFEPRTLRYIVLNANDCKRCHENEGVTMAIGPTAANLNGDYAYADGVRNQLAHWAQHGLLEGVPNDPAQIPRLARCTDPADGTAEVRARAWLQVNCAHCHNPKGAGGVTGLDLRLHQTSPIRLGIYKPPVAAGRGSEGHRYSIDPGSPDTSFLVNRLVSDDPAVMMPPIGRRLPAEEGLALVREWIGSMEFDPTEAERLRQKQQELYDYVQREGVWPEQLVE